MSQKFTQGVRKALFREWRRMKDRPFYVVAPIIAMAFSVFFFYSFMKEGYPNQLPIAVVDLDQSGLSRTYIRNLEVTQQTKVVARCATYSEALDMMQRGKIYAFVLVPEGLETGAISGRTPEITYYLNDAYLIAGSLVLKDITYMNVLTSAAMQQKVLQAKGMPDNEILGVIQPVAVDNHMLANPWANYAVYLVNVLIPGILQLFILMLTIMAVGIELKERTARTWLRASGGSLFSAIVGKLLPYTVLFSALGFCCNIMLYKFMHFPMNGSFGMMCLATVFYVIATQAIGVLFVGLLPDLRKSISMGAFFGLLGFTYAGFTFPIESMPVGAQIFSDLFPLRHYYLIYVAEALNGVGGHYTLIYFASLSAFTLLPLLIWRRLKKTILYY